MEWTEGTDVAGSLQLLSAQAPRPDGTWRFLGSQRERAPGHSLASGTMAESILPVEAMPARCKAVATVRACGSPKSCPISPQLACDLPTCLRHRIQELAKPKKTACPNDPRLVCGNQETIWTLSRGAVTAQVSPRIVALAKPKRDFGKHQCRPLFLYSCGRESPIWERPLPVGISVPSDRLLKLSEPKKCHAAYLQQRPRDSPQWPVSPAARSCKASRRILELSQPKVLHSKFLPAREVPTKVTNVARASSRLQRLAEPRIRNVTCCCELSLLESAIRPVSKGAQEAIASPRTLELGRAKKLHPDYLPLRDAEWPVTEAAKRAVVTPRLSELAKPCKRPPMRSVQFNPDAFTVKETAKKAICSARIRDLARPIMR